MKEHALVTKFLFSKYFMTMILIYFLLIIHIDMKYRSHRDFFRITVKSKVRNFTRSIVGKTCVNELGIIHSVCLDTFATISKYNLIEWDHN